MADTREPRKEDKDLREGGANVARLIGEMSTYGGDSWVPEAQLRKRRVDELLKEEFPDDEVLRMSNGRLACLVCPQQPTLDTISMLHVHRKGARHLHAAEKQSLRKQRFRHEVNKRIALGTLGASKEPFVEERRKAPLVTATRNSTAKILAGSQVPVRAGKSVSNLGQQAPQAIIGMDVSTSSYVKQPVVASHQPSPVDMEAERIRRSQELRLIESGWKRDSGGKWCKDENVEFDSDEETPSLL